MQTSHRKNVVSARTRIRVGRNHDISPVPILRGYIHRAHIDWLCIATLLAARSRTRFKDPRQASRTKWSSQTLEISSHFMEGSNRFSLLTLLFDFAPERGWRPVLHPLLPVNYHPWPQLPALE
ncbi:hypothetical protein MCOR28_008469 [Pyricularia oryzae]|nr:hypothetical protein MCOR28_008469 [Pyricularia oryzae]KAI6466202.1 hypothetical protein MCOR18_009939 [Pyricularia oryzae]